MKLIQRKDYVQMPWKNGHGLSEEIDKNLVDWRLSAAHIDHPTAFSVYPGCRRLLSLWKGRAIFLNDYVLKPGEVYEFEGDEQIYCRNPEGPVTDIGLIFDPQRVEAKMIYQQFHPEEVLKLDHPINLLFCSAGTFHYSNFNVVEGETLKIENQSEVEIKFRSVVSLIVITIKKRP